MELRGRLSEADIAAMTVAQVRDLIAARHGGDAQLWALLERDRRVGVRRLAVGARRARGRAAADRDRRERLQEGERALWGRGLTRVAGVDEVGRGCLAGPVVAAAVVLPPGCDIARLDDSKALAPRAREALSAAVMDRATAVAVAAVDAGEIDRVNILQASMKAMRQALAGLEPPAQEVLVDGNRGPSSGLPEWPLVGGDRRSISIAAASVVAKVHRDRLMIEYEAQYPGYGFGGHKGYASCQHLQALRELGPCPIHRMSFRPLAPDPQAHLDLQPPASAARGRRGEELARQYLCERGWRILATGYRGAGGEIDLVAAEGDCLVFVEVKTARADGLVDPVLRLRPRQRHHLERAARHYLSRHPPAGDCRFDVVAVSMGAGGPRIDHLRDAFSAPRT